VPDDYVDHSFEALYHSMARHLGIIPIGLLRDEVSSSLGNVLPFVMTNPLPSMVLRKSDLVYVLATAEQLT
jgi:hypothetical protein